MNTSDEKGQGPVLFDLSEDVPANPRPEQTPPATPRPERAYDTAKARALGPEITPADAPPVPDAGPALPEGAAMQAAARLAARRGSALGRLFWGALGALVSAMVGIAFWDFATGLLARAPVLGAMVSVLTVIVLLVACIFVARELGAMMRLSRLDALQRRAARVRADADLEGARKLVQQLSNLYASRPELTEPRARLSRLAPESFEVDTVLSLTEDTLLAPLDKAAQEEVAAAARQVATITAIVPLAAADVVAALTANLRMIRRIAEIYGGRGGTFGNWRLTRTVFQHLVATGAVAVGDDLIGSIAGGGVLSKLSRRFGEGLVNGALTARVGVAALEVCRPLPFSEERRPSTTGLTRRALAGLFSKGTGSQGGQ